MQHSRTLPRTGRGRCGGRCPDPTHVDQGGVGVGWVGSILVSNTTNYLDFLACKSKNKEDKKNSFMAPFYRDQLVKKKFLFLKLNILTIAVSYFLGH